MMSNLNFAYFPGCSAESTGLPFTMSMDYVVEKIGMQLTEIDDWCCCGTSAARLTDPDLAIALPSRSLALSEAQFPNLDVLASCAGCYSSLKAASHYAKQSDGNLDHVKDLIELDYEARNDVKSLLEVMVDPEVIELVVSELGKTLGGMKLACYYGCALVRPPQVCQFDDPENPTSMERLMDAAGAECVDWAYKTECCGAANQVVAPNESRVLVERIFRNAQANGAEAIVTACPLCWLNLDMREGEINRKKDTDFNMPVYYFTELLAMAMGATPAQAGIDKHFWPAIDFARNGLEDTGRTAQGTEEVGE